MEAINMIPQDSQLPPPVSDLDIVRAWRDPRYRRSLSAEQLQRVPDNPAGPTDLAAGEVELAAGLKEAAPITTAIGCTRHTFAGPACGCLPTAN
jgi:mersacidin/lichenicidin family type 2 lantibiotic